MNADRSSGMGKSRASSFTKVIVSNPSDEYQATERTSPGSIHQDIWKNVSSNWGDSNDAEGTRKPSFSSDATTLPLSRRTSNNNEEMRSPLFGLSASNSQQPQDAVDLGFRNSGTSPRFFTSPGTGSSTPGFGVSTGNVGGNILERFAMIGEATREAEMFHGLKNLTINDGNLPGARSVSLSEMPSSKFPISSRPSFPTSPYASPKPTYASAASNTLAERAAAQQGSNSRSSSFGSGVWQPPNHEERETVRSPSFMEATSTTYFPAVKSPGVVHSSLAGNPADEYSQATLNEQPSHASLARPSPRQAHANMAHTSQNTTTGGSTSRQAWAFQNAQKFVPKGIPVSVPMTSPPNSYLAAASAGASSHRPSGLDPSKGFEFVPGAGLVPTKIGNGHSKGANNSSNDSGHASTETASVGGSGHNSNGHSGSSYIGRGNRRNQESSSVRSPLLEDFRNNKNRKFELNDLHDHVVEFSSDQHGSRFIQHKLETASTEEKDMVFSEVRPSSLQLMTDVFGNYVIQKFFELGNTVQRTILAKQMEGHVLELSLQMYGCRVVQKAIENIDSKQQIKLVQELDGHILRCVKDQNGNHVVQKAIERIPPEMTGFIIESFRDQTYQLATHPYGCRVIQRMLEYSSQEAQAALLSELETFTFYLVEDQYGNYVVQHIIEHGNREDKNKIIDLVRNSVLTFSRHKFASNVVEKCILHGSTEQKKKLIDVVLTPKEDGTLPISVMMKDQFANYVIQKLLDTTTGEDHDRLAGSIRPHLTALKRYSYGKHLASIEKLVGDESSAVPGKRNKA